MRNILEKWISYLHQGGSLKSRKYYDVIVDEFFCVTEINYVANSEMTHLTQLPSINP